MQLCVAQCVPTCGGKPCGDNGCGGQCGTCGDGLACIGSQCVKPADCFADTDCDDGDKCTVDSCLALGCSHSPSSSPACCTDTDKDGLCDPVDNCPKISNPTQADTDKDGIGDACDDDLDGDKVPNASDNCMSIFNPDQKNTDGDQFGDACDADDDNDGYVDPSDNCPLIPNVDQTDTDKDKVGDACDNCIATPNDQVDGDLDGVGDACDNCPAIQNADQKNLDKDSKGDVCDDDIDGDGYLNAQDCAPYDSSSPQALDVPCDGIDNNCNGITDEGGVGVWQFDDGTNGGWTFTAPISNVGWQVWSKSQSKTAPGALWYGNPETGNYDAGGNASSGEATSPIVNLPKGVKVTLSYWYLFAIEGGTTWDTIDLQIATESGAFNNWTTLVAKGASTIINAWANQLVDLSGYGGQNVRFRFAFASKDGLANTTAGVFIDSFAIGSGQLSSVDTDGDGSPDTCDADDDNDGVIDTSDNCPLMANPDQLDNEKDGLGDVCDLDDDNDGIVDVKDNCPKISNADQKDSNGNGIGDACENGSVLPWKEIFDEYSQTFGEGGWTVQQQAGFGPATWALGVTQSSATGKNAQVVAKSNFPNFTTAGTLLISPVLKTGTQKTATLTFDMGYTGVGGPGGGQLPSNSTISVRISSDGSSWTDVQTINVPTSPASSSYKVAITLPSSGSVQIGFLLTSTAVIATTATWTVDNIVLQ